jgi:hypothetical protein
MKVMEPLSCSVPATKFSFAFTVCVKTPETAAVPNDPDNPPASCTFSHAASECLYVATIWIVPSAESMTIGPPKGFRIGLSTSITSG